MARTFHFNHPDFASQFSAFLREPRGGGEDVDRQVADIIAEVRRQGAAALIAYARQFDRVELEADQLRLTEDEIAQGAEAASPEVRAAITFAAARIGAYHTRQRPADARFVDAAGVELGWRWTALDSVGIYVPGGRAAYPSTVLMNAVPAKVAGVARIAMVTPPGRLEPSVLAAAQAAGVSEIWRVGGAQAVAALAYGAGALRPVDKIVGPGNAYVTAAKRRLYGVVGIDALAGPSEIVVVADANHDPNWVAADLLSQAEHDPAAQSILITDSEDFARQVTAAVDQQLATLATADVARASWRDHGAVILAPLDASPDLVNQIAPEHVEFLTSQPDLLANRVRHAGAIFLGPFTPEALGDYVAGSNHVLPTSGSARFSSGLSIYDFLKRTSILRCSAEAYGELGPHTVALAEAEGLPAHAHSARARLSSARPT